jgi:hypothetical protein
LRRSRRLREGQEADDGNDGDDETEPVPHGRFVTCVQDAVKTPIARSS